MLTEQVEAGDLPPVADRQPKNPLVVEPVEGRGTFGGEWRLALLGAADATWMARTIGYECLVRWDPAWERVVPNLAADFEYNEEGTEFTFHLREGVRWSDGQPFTADDVVFAIEDVYLNDELTPTPPSWLGGGEARVTVEKIGRYSVRIAFDSPQGLFLYSQASLDGTGLASMPLHYLRRFHKRHNPDVEQLAEEEGESGWVELFGRKGGVIEDTSYNALWQNPELPTLHAWKVVTPLGSGTTAAAERNPYYWKVDSAGAQLPYIDRVTFDIINNEEVMLTRALNGAVHMDTRHVNTIQNKPVLARGREDGAYHFIDVIPEFMNTMVISLNLTHKNAAKRELFSNKDFRIGLSHAINRDEIVATVYASQGEPWQIAPRPESDLFYDEEMAKQYTEYDVTKANQYLDDAGYSRTNDEGIRLDSAGEPIKFSVDVVGNAFPDHVDALDLIRGYWRDVGIDMTVKSEDESLFGARLGSNDHDAAVWAGEGGLKSEIIVRPAWYFPQHRNAIYATAWGLWYATRGQEGEEPAEPARQQMEVYDQLKATVDEEERTRLMREILRISKEEFWCIGTSLFPTSYGIVRNELHNVPRSMPGAYLYPTPGPTNPEQYYLDGE